MLDALDREELGLGLVVAVHVDPPGVVAAGEREMEPARGVVVRQALPDHQPEDRGGGEGLARVDHVEGLSRAEGLDVGPRPSADVVLGVDVLAELLGELSTSQSPTSRCPCSLRRDPSG